MEEAPFSRRLLYVATDLCNPFCRKSNKFSTSLLLKYKSSKIISRQSLNHTILL